MEDITDAYNLRRLAPGMFAWLLIIAGLFALAAGLRDVMDWLERPRSPQEFIREQLFELAAVMVANEAEAKGLRLAPGEQFLAIDACLENLVKNRNNADLLLLYWQRYGPEAFDRKVKFWAQCFALAAVLPGLGIALLRKCAR